MAAWQFDLHLLPTSTIVRRYGVVPIFISSEDFDSTNWWSSNVTVDCLATEFSAILPPLRSWSSNLRMWGEDDGNRVDVGFRDDSITEIFVRVDVRVLSTVFLTGIVKIARQHYLKVRPSNGRLLSPTLRQLMEEIHSSPAFRFVKDPAAYLTALEHATHSEEE